MVGHHLQHFGTIVIDGIEKLLATTTTGREHHLIGGLEVFLVAKITRVAIFAISLAGNGQLQLVGQVVERIAHLFYLLRLVIPLFHLLRVLLHLYGKVVIYGQILLGSIEGSALQTLLDNREAVEHLVRDVQRQHRHQYHVHQIDHLLTGRNRSFLNCHNFFLYYRANNAYRTYRTYTLIFTCMASIMRA